MKKSFRIIASLISVSILFGSPTYAATQMEKEAFECVNQERTERGLSELEWDENIYSASKVRAEEISVNFSHTRPNGGDWYTVNEDLLYGENLAMNYRDAESVTDAWMASPEHKENILNGSYTTGAISCYKENNNTYWVQEFGYNY